MVEYAGQAASIGNTIDAGEVAKWRRRAEWLAIFTVLYNVVEGVIAIAFGLEDETIALFGFGVDSFVEVISGVGIWHMIRRQREPGEIEADQFERTALRITGYAMYVLALGLIITAGLSLTQGHAPQQTWWGVGISTVSILTMWALIWAKRAAGRALSSPAIMADAQCNMACLQFSLVLLASSGLYELTGIGGFDAVGAIVIALLCVREGRESLNEAKGVRCACHEKACATET